MPKQPKAPAVRAKLTVDQLKSRSWPTREAALKVLKASGVPPQGADYQLGKGSPNSWVLLDRSDIAVTDDDGELTGLVPVPAKPAKVATAAAKKEHPAETADRAAIDNAGHFTIHFRVSPKTKIDRTAATLDEARAVRDELNMAHGSHGRRAGIYAHPKGKGKAIIVPDSYEAPTETAPEAPPVASNPPAEPKAPPPEGADLTPLDAAGGPYWFRIDAAVPTSVVAEGMEILRRVAGGGGIKHTALTIHGPDNEVRRRLDIAVIREAQARQRTNGTGRAQKRASDSNSKSARVGQLLLRLEGGTMAQIREITEWAPGMRTLTGIAQKAGGKLVTIAKHHWRIEKDA